MNEQTGGKIWNPKNNAPQPKIREQAFICDIDGTVAQMCGNRTPYEWEKVGTDAPDPIIIDLSIRLVQTGLRCVFVTGRLELAYETTHDWLIRHIPFYEKEQCPLFMRPDEGKIKRPDTEIKWELYKNNIEPFYDIQFALDDRNRIVNMWRENGLKCLQVQEGNF